MVGIGLEGHQPGPAGGAGILAGGAARPAGRAPGRSAGTPAAAREPAGHGAAGLLWRMAWTHDTTRARPVLRRGDRAGPPAAGLRGRRGPVGDRADLPRLVAGAARPARR